MNTNEAKELLILDPCSGEIVGSIYEGDRILPKFIEQRLKEDIGNENQYINLSRRYVKYFDGMAEELAKLNLSSTDILVMLFLAEHTRTGSGAVLHNNNQPVTKETLVQAFSVCRKTIDGTFRKLEENGIIAICTTGKRTKYFFNPYILMRGRYINKTLYQMFNKTYWYKFGKPSEIR